MVLGSWPPDRLQGLDGGPTRLADGPTLRLVALDARRTAPTVVRAQWVSSGAQIGPRDVVFGAYPRQAMEWALPLKETLLLAIKVTAFAFYWRELLKRI